jgi:5-methyltetrahydropteroyltriglutamate--homocysteine methyltransferase
LIIGGDQDCYHSFEVDYLLVLPAVFDLHLANFFLQLTSEPNRRQVLSRIKELIKPGQRVFVGVIDPVTPRVETPEEVCERVLEAAEFIPIEQLGTTDDCGFSPFNDDKSTSRQIAFDKIRARIQGTKLAEEKLMEKKK